MRTPRSTNARTRSGDGSSSDSATESAHSGGNATGCGTATASTTAGPTVTSIRAKHGLTVIVVSLLALSTACTTEQPTEPPRASATPSATPTPDAPLTRENALQVALAMVPQGATDWNGPYTSNLVRIDVCPEVEPFPGVVKGVYVGDQSLEHSEDGPLTQPLEVLEGGSIATPDGEQDAALRIVRAIATCPTTDGKTTRVVTPLPAADGSAAVRVDETHPQSGTTKGHETYAFHAHRGIVAGCRAQGIDPDAVAEAALACGTRATAAVDVIHDGMPAAGTLSSAAVVAGRLRATKDLTVGAAGHASGEPCYGGGLRPDLERTVSVQLFIEDSGIAPAFVDVQATESAEDAAREVQAYRALARRCATGEHELYPATVTRKAIVVTRTAARLTDTAGDGIRFSSLFGTAKEKRGTFQTTEVFAVGPHVVVVSGEDQDDPAVAAANVDAAIRDVLRE